MAELKSKSNKEPNTQSTAADEPTSAGESKLSGTLPTVPISTCFPTIPFVSCPPPPTIAGADCSNQFGAQGGFPTLSCIPTIPGVSCPIPTVPISSCLPMTGATPPQTTEAMSFPTLSCIPTIPGVSCPLPTSGCVPQTIPGVNCPIPTVPVSSCLPLTTETHLQMTRGGASPTLIGCPATISCPPHPTLIGCPNTISCPPVTHSLVCNLHTITNCPPTHNIVTCLPTHNIALCPPHTFLPHSCPVTIPSAACPVPTLGGCPPPSIACAPNR